MQYGVRLTSVTGTPLLVVRRRATLPELSRVVPEAHEAVRQWCNANHHRLASPNWEVYGHWIDDPEELRTDVFYLLTTDAKPAA